jgi:hypothetical protein
VAVMRSARVGGGLGLQLVSSAAIKRREKRHRVTYS